MNPPESQPTPQFSKAEYVGESGTDRCAGCSQPILNEYYRVNDKMVCPTCTVGAQNALPKDTHGAFVRAVLFGCGGAILGLILYSAFGIITGWEIGYISLAVGYIVGWAMMMGSKGMGGRRYQVVAALLTYAAVSMSAVPIAISMQLKEAKEQKQVTEQQTQLDSDSGLRQSEPPAQPTPQPGSSSPPERGLAAMLGSLALLGLASPFLELQESFQGIIGLVILAVGIRIAWRMTGTRLPTISGPFHNSPT